VAGDTLDRWSATSHVEGAACKSWLVEPKTYRVTATIGGRRSLLWPLGLLDVTDTGLRLHSWHWSWWVEDEAVDKKAIGTIRVSGSFGSRTIVVPRRNAQPWVIRPAWAKACICDLQARGYVLDLQDYRG